MKRVLAAVVSQFHRPRGPAGWLVGWEMALRASNRRRNRWAVSLLDVQPTDRVLEIGFGPGIAIREAARQATSGHVAGIDHSAEMVRQATSRNGKAVQEGRVELHQLPVEALPAFDSPFDKVLAVNSIGFWPNPVERLVEMRSVIGGGGVIAIVSQPRCPGATSEHTDGAELEIRRQLAEAGFADLRSERLGLHPPVICVLATNPIDPGDRPSRRGSRSEMADETTSQARQTWEAVAPAWEDHRDQVFAQTRKVSERLAELVDPKPGDTILELAAGTGETGFLLAGRVGPEGRLISSDFSEAMVKAAQRGATGRGLANVECRVMDAQAIDLPDSSVDAALSRFGLMLVPDPLRALKQCHRVLRPGGRLVYAVWGTIDRNPWIALLGAALLQRGHVLGGDPFAPGGLFSLAEPERNLQLVTDAGFAAGETEEITGAMEADSLDDYWNFQSSISGPITTLLAVLPPDEQAAIRADFRSAAQPYRAGDRYRLPNCALVVHAKR